MPLFRQIAYYESNGLMFVDRENYFKDKEESDKNLIRFACSSENRIPNQIYICKSIEILSSQQSNLKTINEELAERIADSFY